MSNMRIHTDRLDRRDLYSAARVARVDLDLTEHGSRSRARAFNITLRGESNRRPNWGTSRNIERFDNPERAATWDQWGVFLASLFEEDDKRVFEPSLPMFTPYDESAEAFATRTADRFGAPEVEVAMPGYVNRFRAYGWPEDAHGDHSWKSSGVPRQRECRHCSAVERYNWGA